MAKQKKLETEDKEEIKPDIEKTIIELAKSGMTSEKIGLVLKQRYNIKNIKKEIGKRISKVLKENNLYVDADIKNIKEKLEKLKKHSEKNKHDYVAKRKIVIEASKLRRLEKYRQK